METALVKFTEYGLSFLCADVHTIISPESLTRLLFAENGDVVIAFCFSNCSDVSLKTVQYCKDAGATIVALSNSQLSPLAKLGDITLVAKTEDESFIDSLIAPMSVSNALLSALISDRNNELREKMNSLGNVWHEYYVEEK